MSRNTIRSIPPNPHAGFDRETYIQTSIDAIPPLTANQISRLTALFDHPGRDGRTRERGVEQ